MVWPDACTQSSHGVEPPFKTHKEPDILPNRCLSDFVAHADSGIKDYLGAFAVTVVHGVQQELEKYPADGDDDNSIIFQALADRLAEAYASANHRRVRRHWGFADTNIDKKHLNAEKQRGIRPAFGFPACPDHTPKRELFEALQASDIGLELTECCAMLPAASVCSLYFSNPMPTTSTWAAWRTTRSRTTPSNADLSCRWSNGC